MAFPHVSRPQSWHEADEAKPATMSHREDWRDVPLITIDPADAKDHDDAVYAEHDPSPDNPDGVIVTVAIADVSWYVRPELAARPRSPEARQLGLFPRPRRADAAGADFQRPLLAEGRRRPPCACRSHGASRRKAARRAIPSIAS